MQKLDFEQYAQTHPMLGATRETRKYVMTKYITPEMTVLDVGCGDGRHMNYICENLSVPQENIYGAEISQIRVNRIQAQGFQCKKIDGINLPYPDRSFDRIIFFEVIEHIPEDKAKILLQEMKRVLKPKGMIIGSTPNYPAKLYHAFIKRVDNRVRHLFDILIPKLQNSFEKYFLNTSFSTHVKKEIRTQSNKDQDKNNFWIIKQFRRLIADDPTHVFFCNFNIIHKLGVESYQDVELYTTFRDVAQLIEIHSFKRLFSHKIIFIFKK